MPTLNHATPILRSFDEQKAREFYLDFLGFTVVFAHRFGDNFPLYLAVSRDGCTLHLSEHFGDGTPGTRLRIACDDVRALHLELAAKTFTYAKPRPPDVTAWQTLELLLTDPFGNMLVFYQDL
jgi:uncharacterized glyoxalase superfamily protein PhnB